MPTQAWLDIQAGARYVISSDPFLRRYRNVQLLPLMSPLVLLSQELFPVITSS